MTGKLRGSPLVLDAALGTELARRGAPVASPLWSSAAIRGATDLLRAIHDENVAAGADVLTTATFRTHARNVKAAGLDPSEARGLTREAVAVAREAARAGAREVLVAGSAAPLEDCWYPERVPDDAALAREHAEHAEALAEAGVDFLLAETIGCVREGVAAARAAAGAGLEAVVAFTLDREGRLLSRETLEEAARALLALPRPPAGIGLSCVPARELGEALARLAAAAPGVPLAAYGNAGLPVDERMGLFTQPVSPQVHAACAADWIAVGARIVGGCCGTSAAHTAALRALVDSL